jgi:hypothetical protein
MLIRILKDALQEKQISTIKAMVLMGEGRILDEDDIWVQTECDEYTIVTIYRYLDGGATIYVDNNLMLRPYSEK